MKNKTQKKKITMDDLAGMINAGTGETKNFVRKEIGDLAGMVQRGFAETAKKVELDGVKAGVINLGNNLRILSENNTREHEEIKLRLDNVAYRFELVELQKRVETLEKRIGIKK